MTPTKRYEIYYTKPNRKGCVFVIVGIACCVESMTRFFEDRGYIVQRILELCETPKKYP